MFGTGIEWTEVTWNPTTGGDRISPGCDNRYALALRQATEGNGCGQVPAGWRSSNLPPGLRRRCARVGAEGSSQLEWLPTGLRQLDERPAPCPCASRLRSPRLRRYGRHATTHLPDARREREAVGRIGWLPEPVAFAAYFVASEALANTAKYARASAATYRDLLRSGTGAVIEIIDDRWVAPTPRLARGCVGSPIASRRSTAALACSSPPGAGTVITADLPCRSTTANRRCCLPISTDFAPLAHYRRWICRAEKPVRPRRGGCRQHPGAGPAW